jgi:hypothetical protein
MSVTPPQVKSLVDWLGPEGAIAGLDHSRLTNAELLALAAEAGHSIDKKTSRRDITVEIVMADLNRIEKSTEELLQMPPEDISKYFHDRMVSSREILTLLNDLGIAPSGKLRGKLSDYAAREIGELGLFQRVARGNTSN